MTERRTLRVDDLAAIPTLTEPALSPDGRLAAYVVTTPDIDEDDYVSAIWWGPTDGSAPPRQVTSGPRDRAPRWSPDGGQLAFVGTRGEMVDQLFVLPVDGGEARPVGQLSGHVSDPQWSPDGFRIAVTSVVRLTAQERPAHTPVVLGRLQYKADGQGLIGDRRSHLFVIDTVTGDDMQVTAGDFSVHGVRWSPDGSALAYTASHGEDRDPPATSVVSVVSAAGGEATALTPPTGIFGAAAWFPDGQQLVICGQERLRAGHQALFVVPSTGGVPKPLVPVDRNVMLGAPGYPGASPVVLSDGRVLFMLRDRGCTHLYGAEPDLAPHCVVGGAERSLSGLSVAGGLIAYVVADPKTPGELWVAKVDGSEERQLTRHFAEALPEVELSEPQSREFTAADGTKIHGWVLRAPETVGATPLLLDIHGGPHNVWTPTFDGVHPYHQELVARGWTVLLVNSRGSDGYGEDFFTVVSGRWGLADEGDFLAAVDTLIEEGLVDSNKVVLSGYSYGGYMSCWLSARFPDRWAAAIPGGVAIDLAGLAGTADIGSGISEMEFGALPWEDPERLRASSPLTYVQHVTAPTLLVQAERDDRCPLPQAEQWFVALRMRNVPAALVQYPEATHNFVLNGRPSHRMDWGRRIVAFATEHTR